MIKETLAGVPDYVRITILAQLKRLLKYTCFDNYNDKNEIIQELLLEYLEIIRSIEEPTEAYIVASIKNRGTALLRARTKECFGLFSSLEDIESTHQLASTKTGFEGLDYKIILRGIMEEMNSRENEVISLILEDLTIREICKKGKVSRDTIYKVIKKIEKKLKK